MTRLGNIVFVSYVREHQICCPSYIIIISQREGGHHTQDTEKCYEGVPHYKPWDNVELGYRKKGGHSLTISNSEKEAFILHFLRQLYLQHQVWNRLHDRRNEENFTWTSG